ncbi:MAG: polyketide cyclase [Candidatus Saccharibacteria bacterium]|jgi:uncharacterized protein YndB with AHSA1/START domain|nr:polyketide cyclase [Candidatus Saccharibacteria bacterium]
MSKPLTVQTTVKAPIAIVWESWNSPAAITKWAFASDDWEAPAAENDLREGGNFKTVMAAKNGSAQFDFAGKYTAVKKPELIEYDMEDGRHVKVEFKPTPDGVLVTETFDPESENPPAKQIEGWHAILTNFKKFVER